MIRFIFRRRNKIFFFVYTTFKEKSRITTAVQNAENEQFGMSRESRIILGKLPVQDGAPNKTQKPGRRKPIIKLTNMF